MLSTLDLDELRATIGGVANTVTQAPRRRHTLVDGLSEAFDHDRHQADVFGFVI